MVNVQRQFSLRFRDSKGQVTRMRFIGTGATSAGIDANQDTMVTDFALATNAHVSRTDEGAEFTKGSSAAANCDVEDKALLIFKDTATGTLHRWQFPAPLPSGFFNDQETVKTSGTPLGQVVTDIQTFCVPYQSVSGTTLVFLGGYRIRRRLQRKFNINVLDPSLSNTGE